MDDRDEHPDDRGPTPLWLKAFAVTLIVGSVVGMVAMLGFYGLLSELSRAD